MGQNSSPIPLELFEAGDPGFVDALRLCHDPDALGKFALDWINDARPHARQFLFDYLERPLNAFRHEVLIKRLFKRAEERGDDALMARFLVLFDRSVSRVPKVHYEYLRHEFSSEIEAANLAQTWRSEGYRNVSTWQMWGTHYVQGGIPRTTLVNRGPWELSRRGVPFAPDQRDSPAARSWFARYRLFKLKTRHYLRRRAWRYFRLLGKKHPERYVSAISQALVLYGDEDLKDGASILSRWGLVHALFHGSSVLKPTDRHWLIRPGRTLAELSPSPMYEALWDQSPAAVFEIIRSARSTLVRQWAIQRVEADPTTHRPGLALEGWIDLIAHSDPTVSALAARVVEDWPNLEVVDVDRWLDLLEKVGPDALDPVCRVSRRLIRGVLVPLDRCLRLAAMRSLLLARLALGWLKEQPLNKMADPSTLMGLIDAECQPLRPEILTWLVDSILAHFSSGLHALIFELLDSRWLDARQLGWQRLLVDPALRSDVETWKRLLESPYDDILAGLVVELESKANQPADPRDLRSLWASVLLNIHRGSRVKPVVIRQVVKRLAECRDSDEGETRLWLDLLSVALRSSRLPERREGLRALVQWLEQRPQMEPLVRSSFPELVLSEGVV